MPIKKKVIFYFEDEPELLSSYIEILREKYEVIVSARKTLIEQDRPEKVDLVIIDLMIHPFTIDQEGNVIAQNLEYPGINWKLTGVEFLRRIRAGNYEAYGFSATMSIIVASALVDYQMRETIEQLEVKRYLEKPFTMDELEESVNAVLID